MNLDRLITFQSNSYTRDNIGGSVDSWVDFCQMWANIKFQPSYENTAGDRVEAKNIVQFTCRYRSDITAAMRISFDGEYFNISDVSEVPRRKFLQITAQSLTT